MKTNIPDLGATRIKDGFLFLPLSIYGGGYDIVKWLVFAKWEETYISHENGDYWQTTRFIE